MAVKARVYFDLPYNEYVLLDMDQLKTISEILLGAPGLSEERGGDSLTYRSKAKFNVFRVDLLTEESLDQIKAKTVLGVPDATDTES